MRITLLYGFALLLLLPTPTTQEEEEENGPVYLEEDSLLISTSLSLSVQCHTDFNLTNTNQHLAWFDPNATDINTHNDSRRYYTPEGELHIDPLYVSDSGEYVCALVTTNSDDVSGDTDNAQDVSVPPNLSEGDPYYHVYNATLDLNVYVMPDYFFAGMILVCINFALCGLFIICLIYSHFKQKSYEKKLMEETAKIQNPAVKELKMYA